jgi:sigma-B regulation protein RsbU (phosphoserine phosphatase)
MFFTDIDIRNRVLRWARAGHEPALFFDADSGSFQTLGGDGVALGVVERASFADNQLEQWAPGSLLLIGTDGIRETEDEAGTMFGLDGLKKVIRDNTGKPANAIREAILAQLQAFRGDAPQEDDITMVVIKLL